VADEITIKVEGLRDLNKTLKRLADDAPKALRQANLAAAKAIVAEALPHVPVGTSQYDRHQGALKKSVKALASATASRMKAGSAAVPYAPAVHWGTGPRPGLKGPHNIKRNAFLWNARQRLLKEVRDEYEKELEALITKTVRGR
jgi:HK97 gp10 family phage protein